MKAQLILLLAFVVAAQAFDFPQDPLFTSFLNYTTTYNKKYTSTEEFLIRFANFKNTLARIQLLNEKPGARHVINKFADLTPEEFKQRYLGFKPSGTRRHAKVTVPPVGDAPTSIDWRTKGAVSAVKNQGQCGSCWAFSATEEIESQWFLAGHDLPVLSEEQIVDCDSTDAGCNGGDTVTAYAYVQSAGGLETEADYPYTAGGGQSGTCNFTQGDVVATISGFTYATPACTDSCDNQDEDTMAANLASSGPVSICVYAESWQTYGGGIYNDASACPHAYTDLDHCVQAVGYDFTDASTPYWIVRNSWGTDWGESGYIRVIKGTNMCGVADEATIVTI